MHPLLFHVGKFAVPTYGVLAVAALLAGIALVRRYARIERLPPTKVSDGIVLVCAVGFVGARVLEIILEWDRYFGRPGAWRALPYSAGVYYGGLAAAIGFGIFWFRRVGLPFLPMIDILALFGAVAMGIGRWGCFFSGCCWGTPTELPWGVTFPEIARRLHRGLPDVPIHPVQIYMSLVSFAILGMLVWIYRRKRFHGQIMASYVIAEVVSRFFLSYIRGDEAQQPVLGGLLSMSQLLGIAMGLAAAAAWFTLDRRHRLSGAPPR